MSDIETNLKSQINEAVANWLPAEAHTLWADEQFLDGIYLQKHVFAVEPTGDISVLRAWITAGQPAAVSVDMLKSFGAFAGEINEDGFPYAFRDNAEELETIFRSHLLGEHVEFVWKSVTDNNYGAFIARTAKVGREEQVIAGVARYENGEPQVEIGYRGALSDFDPRNHSAAFKI